MDFQDKESASGGRMLFPPSCNWFCSSAMDSREQDRLLCYAAFKNIVLCRMEIGVKLPVVLKTMSHMDGKVLMVRLFPDANHSEHGNNVLVAGEYGQVAIYSGSNGAIVMKHKKHKNTKIGGICWMLGDGGTEGGDDDDKTVFAVSVASAGAMEVWNTETNLTRRLVINPNLPPGAANSSNNRQKQVAPPDLTMLEPMPSGGGNVLVAVDNLILVVNIKNGHIMTQLRGHDQSVYCMKWYKGDSCPLNSALPQNSRAQALLATGSTTTTATTSSSTTSGSCSTSSGTGSDSSNWRERSSVQTHDDPNSSVTTESPDGGSKGPFLATSDTGRNILLWDMSAKRYVAKLTVPGSSVYQSQAKKDKRGKFGRQAQHTALAWHKSQLLANNSIGEIMALSFWENTSRTSHFETNTSSKKKTDKDNEDDEENEEPTVDEDNNVESEGRKVKKKDRRVRDEEQTRSGFKSKTVHKEHTRVVYNMEMFDGMVVSYCQDRSVVGYCLNTKKVCFNMPTISSFVGTLSFCPHDSSWMALGMSEFCIKLMHLHSTPPVRTKCYSYGIKGKVQSLSWNVDDETQLMYGTADGQVGVVDVNTQNVSQFSYFHQRAVYKVEWAPPVPFDQFPSSTGRGPNYAYSYGDREIVMRDPRAPMSDPVKLNKLYTSFPDNITEFSFSPDYKFIAVGCQDGMVSVINSFDLTALVKMVFVRKSIQHILWKPFTSGTSASGLTNGTGDSVSKQNRCYNITIGSNDSRIFIIDLSSVLQDQLDKLAVFKAESAKVNEAVSTEDNDAKESDAEGSAEKTPEEQQSMEERVFESVMVSSCDRELSGHTSRVVWLSYSQHNPNHLASASFDHTCQIWNVATGQHVGNYRGHATRVFRVEFCPNEAGVLYSTGEESAVLQWRMSDLIHKSPPPKESKASADNKKKYFRGAGVENKTTSEVDDTDGTSVRKPARGNSYKPLRSSTPNVGKVAAAEGDDETKSEETGSDVGAVVGSITTESRKSAPHKTLFPMLHHATALKKRGFVLLATLCLNEQHKLVNDKRKKEYEKDLEELFEEEEQPGQTLAGAADDIPRSASHHYPAMVAQLGSILLDQDQAMDTQPSGHMDTLLDFYGPPTLMSGYMIKQIEEHDRLEHESSSNLLHCWRGSLEKRVRDAIVSNKLTADLVAMCPQVSTKLWEVSSEAYAHQLAVAGDPLLASAYFINAKKVIEAVDVLLKHKLYREALALAKTRLPYDDRLHHRVLSSFASQTLNEGHFDRAALLYSCAGEYSSAANSLCRRGDPSSLLVAGLLYKRHGDPLASVTMLDALKCAAAKNDLDHIPAAIDAAPEHSWFGLILVTLKTLQEVKRCAAEHGKGFFIFPQDAESKDDSTLSAESAVSVSSTTATAGSAVSSAAPTAAVEDILERWQTEGFTAEQHPQLLRAIRQHLHSSQQPLTQKQFWFLISVQITAMLLSLSVASSGEEASPPVHTPSQAAPSPAVDASESPAADAPAPAVDASESPAADAPSPAADAPATPGAEELQELLQLTFIWGKPDQAFDVTHILLPRGPEAAPSVLISLMKKRAELESVQLLHLLYHTSDYHNWSSTSTTAGGIQQSGGQKEKQQQREDSSLISEMKTDVALHSESEQSSDLNVGSSDTKKTEGADLVRPGDAYSHLETTGKSNSQSETESTPTTVKLDSHFETESTPMTVKSKTESKPKIMKSNTESECDSSGLTIKAKSDLELSELLRSLIAALSYKCSIIPHNNLCEIDVFRDPKPMLRKTIEDLSARGLVEKTVIDNLSESLKKLEE